MDLIHSLLSSLEGSGHWVPGRRPVRAAAAGTALGLALGSGALVGPPLAGPGLPAAAAAELLPAQQSAPAPAPAPPAADPAAQGGAAGAGAVATPGAPDGSPQELRSEEASLAKQLANPVASLISVPFQANFDARIGREASIQRSVLNIQPVVPLRLNTNWNLISRTILPVVLYSGQAGTETGQLNVGDTLQSLFVSPAQPGPAGVIWGVGPVALLPTATGQLSGIQQWGLGPTGVVLVQRGQWTVGALANHLWSVANNGPGPNLNASFVQPFLSYTTRNAWSLTLNSESTYDWEADRWAVPINLVLGKVTKVGNQLLSLGAGVRYWVDGPDKGPHGWAGRLLVTLLFPTR